jgi:hypothetical protein
MTRAQRHRYAGYVKGLAHQRPGGGLVAIVLLGRQLHATDMPLRRAGVEDRSPAKPRRQSKPIASAAVAYNAPVSEGIAGISNALPATIGGWRGIAATRITEKSNSTARNYLQQTPRTQQAAGGAWQAISGRGIRTASALATSALAFT